MSTGLREEGITAAWTWVTTELAGAAVPDFLVLLGLGDLSVLDALDRHAPSTRILALEPDPAAARAFREDPKWDAARRAGKVLVLADPGYDGADTAWRTFPAGDEMPRILVHPQIPATEGTARAAQTLKKILFGFKANQDARRKFAPTYLVNSLRNLPALAAGYDVRALTDAYRGVPAVIAAAGPSLDLALPQLQRAAGRALLIACDTALRPLLGAGIHPQLVVGVDPSSFNARHFHWLSDCPDTWLVAESALDRSATQAFDGRTFWFRVSNHQPWPWFRSLGIDAGEVAAWGSVLTSAFDLACVAGCDPIVLVGADLAYSGGRPYARGTTYEFDWAWQTSRGTDLDEIFRQQIARQDLQKARDLLGDETLTTPTLTAFRDWIVTRARRSGRRVINATPGGVLHGEGIETGELDAALPRKIDICSPARFAGSHRPIQSADLAVNLRAAADAVRDERPGSIAAAWREFAGPGFSQDEVLTAIGDAAAELGGTGGVYRPGSIDPGAGAHLTTRLPELTARLRSAHAAGDVVQIAPAGDRTALVETTLHLLEGISIALEARDADIEPLSRPDLVAPANSCFTWPEPVGWAAGMFDGILGALVAGRLDPVCTDFFTTPSSPRQADDETILETPNARWPVGRHACVLMALEWIRVVCGGRDAGAGDRLVAVATAIHTAPAAQGARGSAALVIRAATAGAERVVRLPLGISTRALAPALTGLQWRRNACDYELLDTSVDGLAIRVSIENADTAPVEGREVSRVLCVPSVLSGRTLPRSFVAYATPRGVVCVPPHTSTSLLVAEDGSVRPHLAWPRPIILELPYGEDGAVAWSNGIEHWPEASTPYVMWRRRASAAVEIVKLPFRPGMGTWWKDRLYWACMPGGIGAWTGVGSWAPDTEPTADLPWRPIYGMDPDVESMQLYPRPVAASGSYERRLLTECWDWAPGRQPQPAAAATEGPVSCSATHGHGWTATAYPELDLVRVRAGEHVVEITCHWPHRLAWAGDSLVVSTMDRDVLIFQPLGAPAASLP